jgi:hypothetical protein
LFVFVQTFDVDANVSDVPDEIMPTLPPAFLSPVVTVLPDDVRGGGAGSGAGAGVLGRVVVGRDGRVVGRVEVDFGAGSGVLGTGAGEAGTSLSCGCAALSPWASCKSRFSAESLASDVSLLLRSPLLHAATPSAAISASGVMRRIYFDILGLRL